MTIRVDIAPGVNGSGATIEQVVNNALFDMDPLPFGTATNFVLVDSFTNERAFVYGTGFTYNASGFPIAGTITTIDYEAFDGTDYSDVITFSQMSASVEALLSAAQAELNGNPAALETLLFSENWEYHGNENPDILLKNANSSDGVPIDLIGDDTFFGGGGNDRFAASRGDDTLFGGGGKDRLWGEGNNDKLVGNRGNDTLFGGGGKDTLIGSGGRDRLKGDKGNDKMKGGAGADVFDFTGANQGTDRILDWQDGIDKIGGVGYQEIEWTYLNGNTVLTHDDGKVIFVGQILTFDTDDFI